MASHCVIVDTKPGFLPGDATDHHSALTMPVGCHAVAAHLVRTLSEFTDAEPLVFPTFIPSEDYDDALRRAAGQSLRIVPPSQQMAQLHQWEVSDVLVVIDARYWGVDGRALADLGRIQTEHGGAVHLVACRTCNETPRERIMLDQEGRVRRVQRLYDRSDWPEVDEIVVPVSIVPQMALERCRICPLTDLRTQLASGGIPNRDVRLETNVHDLGLPQDLLAACRAAFTDDAVDACASNGFARRDPGVLVERDGVEIASSARLVGPLVVHRGAVVEADATVVGPGIIGAGAVVGRGAVVAQSILLPGANVAADASIRTAIVADDTTVVPEPIAPTAANAGSDVSINRVAARGTPTVSVPHRPIYPYIKRTVDFLVALVLLILLAPFAPFLIVLIKLDSKGPAFFAHGREGLGGREFGCVKFRTMRPDADRLQRELAAENAVDGPQFKIGDDPRITRVGKVLRALNLDELPQLYNVLRGDMSLVGPRPSPFRENQVCAPWRRARLSVRPGITGLWQVCRSDRDEGDFHQWIYYDVLYVRRLSFWLDVKILWATMTSLGGQRHVPIERVVKTASLGPDETTLPMAASAGGA